MRGDYEELEPDRLGKWDRRLTYATAAVFAVVMLFLLFVGGAFGSEPTFTVVNKVPPTFTVVNKVNAKATRTPAAGRPTAAPPPVQPPPVLLGWRRWDGFGNVWFESAAPGVAAPDPFIAVDPPSTGIINVTGAEPASTEFSAPVRGPALIRTGAAGAGIRGFIERACTSYG